MVNNLDEPDIEGERCLTLANCRPRTVDNLVPRVSHLNAGPRSRDPGNEVGTVDWF